MSQRQSYKSIQKQRLRVQARNKARRKRLLLIGGVVLAALAAVFVLIRLGPAAVPVSADSFITPAPKTWPLAEGKSLGPVDAPVVVQVFADYQCPFCRQFHDTIAPQIISEYVSTGLVRLEYVHLIIIDNNVGGNESRHAAQASECAADQGRFWDYYDMLYANQAGEGSGAYADARLKAFAAALGLDTAQFNSCLNSRQAAQKVTSDETRAATNRLNSTPSLLVNGMKVEKPMDYSQVQAAIDFALGQAGG